jgi:hypothetical protein
MMVRKVIVSRGMFYMSVYSFVRWLCGLIIDFFSLEAKVWHLFSSFLFWFSGRLTLMI